MTPREADRRLRLLESAVLTLHPDAELRATDLERWAATVSDGALMRAEQLCGALAADPGREGQPMGELGCALVECACLDADPGDADPVRRSYLAGQPHDPSDLGMAGLRARVERWIADPARAFMRGADVRSWLAWHGVAVEQLSPGELVRLAALLQVLEAHPGEAATLQPDVIWAVIGRDGRRKWHGIA
jgi:hypothetical protein